MKVEHLKDLLKTQMNAVMAWINTSAAELKEYTEELRKEEIEAAKNPKLNIADSIAIILHAMEHWNK